MFGGRLSDVGLLVDNAIRIGGIWIIISHTPMHCGLAKAYIFYCILPRPKGRGYLHMSLENVVKSKSNSRSFTSRAKYSPIPLLRNAGKAHQSPGRRGLCIRLSSLRL